MTKLTALVLAGLVALSLSGCGKNPTAASGGEGRIKRTTGIASTVAPKAATAAKASTAAKTAAPAKAAGTAKAATRKAATPVQTSEEGTIAVAIAVTGNAPVASLSFKIFDQADPTAAMEAPLALTGGRAAWEQADVPAGRYTLQVKALAADGKVLGQGSTEAIVKNGEPTEVSLDLRVNVAAAPTQVTPVDNDGQSGIAEVGDEEAPSTTTTPTAPVKGGILGINIEVF